VHEGENAEVSTAVGASAESEDECVDDSVDTSTRERLVEALTDAVRDLLAEGDGEGARVALRALEELARLVAADDQTGSRVADLEAARARRREPT
jgi:hypothetical protein